MTKILQGDCREVLKTLPDESVNCCVTSPPYWGLRDYGHGGQIGLEQTPAAYVAEMVAVFAQVKRVLRDDGTLWLNLGDSYAAQRGGTCMPAETLAGGVSGEGDEKSYRGRPGGAKAHEVNRHTQYMPARNASAIGLKHKDLVGIPWRVAFALQADGWYLRQDIIWAKPNPMPESVKDRCCKSHEYVFLMSKSERYYFDQQAISEPASDDPVSSARRNRKDLSTVGTKAIQGSEFGQSGMGANADYKGDTRTKRSVWTVCTKPYREAHFAVFPPELIAPMILAGCPVGGTVLDPFGGSGTTGETSERLGRNSVMIELNPAYIALQEKRTAQMGLGL